ncbi:sigma-70 family RNA polymerase sigma factor [Gemmata sp. JC673]|uniref:Sigma-70 family RNA polymerase sigma factor n=1 Tax=Gemmata algarum TaxID=2975278 RepID=A0ABU5F439_9BACT|nr:sigma-70 family RNA polymerase sigma factor [Gemmata algarum]MDY3560654.1 sigma-70 family RNA polymerase sigma factor [Gemmata algarum]
MSQSVLTAAVTRARRAARADLADGELVTRFGATGDPDAFAQLVRRHGPMVSAVCRRITRHRHDAEDAFQAAFLVLARKAGELDPPGAVGGWLFGVAVNTARAARRRSARRCARESLTAAPPEVGGCEPEPDFDTRAAVADALAELPERYRALVVACDLRGESQAVVARQLGMPVGTVYSRLSTARRLLAERLRRRGVGAAAGAAALGALAPDAAALSPISDCPSASVTELTEAIMAQGSALKWKLAACMLLVGVTLGLGAEPFKPGPAPAPAPRPADESRLVLRFGGHVRFLKPDGTEVARVTAADAVKAGADMPTQSLSLGFSSGQGIRALRAEAFGLCGRVAPDGRLPLETRKGLYLLTPGAPPAVAPVKVAKGGEALFASSDVPPIVAWSADGRRAVGCRLKYPLFSTPVYEHVLIDLAAGTTIALNLPKNHKVVGWSADGWFLTIGEERLGYLKGWSVTSQALCKVSASGRISEVLATYSFAGDWTRTGEWLNTAALSPDGARVACLVNTTEPVGEKKEPLLGLKITAFDLAKKERVAVLHEERSRLPWALNWAPDGSRLAFLCFSHDYQSGALASSGWHIGVVGADGTGAKTVFSSDFPGGKGMPAAQLDWR